jgi:hypothetical protein
MAAARRLAAAQGSAIGELAPARPAEGGRLRARGDFLRGFIEALILAAKIAGL